MKASETRRLRKQVQQAQEAQQVASAMSNRVYRRNREVDLLWYLQQMVSLQLCWADLRTWWFRMCGMFLNPSIFFVYYHYNCFATWYCNDRSFQKIKIGYDWDCIVMQTVLWCAWARTSDGPSSCSPQVWWWVYSGDMEGDLVIKVCPSGGVNSLITRSNPHLTKILGSRLECLICSVWLYTVYWVLVPSSWLRNELSVHWWADILHINTNLPTHIWHPRLYWESITSG